MIKLLAFVASIISGAQVDVAYASHQLRGVLKHPFVPRRLTDEAHICMTMTVTSLTAAPTAPGGTGPTAAPTVGQDILVFETFSDMCADTAAGEIHGIHSAETEFCTCYSSYCKEDICCTGNEGIDDPACLLHEPPGDAEGPGGCHWKAINEGEDCPEDDAVNPDEHDIDCRVAMCDVSGSGDCAYVAANQGKEGCTSDDDTLMDEECRKTLCNGAGQCVWEADNTGKEGCTSDDPTSLDEECRKTLCNDAGQCVWTEDNSGGPCGDGATECQERDYCEAGLCVEGVILEGKMCGVCNLCSAAGDCELVSGTRPKHTGFQFVVRDIDNNGFHDGTVYAHCKAGSIHELDPDKSSGYPVYQVDVVDHSNCAGGGKFNELKISTDESGPITAIHTSCSEPIHVCNLMNEPGFGLTFTASEVDGSWTVVMDPATADWENIDCLAQ
ncbi:hypothetical protein ACHAXT_000713 [Thalassiosira profunda]